VQVVDFKSDIRYSLDSYHLNIMNVFGGRGEYQCCYFIIHQDFMNLQPHHHYRILQNQNKSIPLLQTQAHGCLHRDVSQFTIFHRCRGMLKRLFNL
jgi:hypothetical protein